MPSETCPTCKRPLPKERSDSPSKRKIFSVAAPQGEDPRHTLVEPLEVLHKELTAKGASIPPIGQMTGWKYYTLALALAILMQNIHGLTIEEAGG